MKGDLEIVMEALEKIEAESWVNIGTITDAFHALRMEIRFLSRRRDDEEEKLRQECEDAVGADAVDGG